MKEAGVPILERPATRRDDFPVLVKASAGGGGRGMRIVRRAEDLDAELAAAEAEAASAFGDGTVFVEPYVERSRHVEVQVVGDGTAAVLGDRDCIVQRRHQKVVEEAPAAPDLRDEVRAALHDAARGGRGGDRLPRRRHRRVPLRPRHRALLLPGDEHPPPGRAPGHRARPRRRPGRAPAAVARRRTALDGAARPDRAGHAIEVRLYAEDATCTAAVGRWSPSTSRPTPSSGRWRAPGSASTRVSQAGNDVSTHYDAMLAKVISWAPTARRRSGSWWPRCGGRASTAS